MGKSPIPKTRLCNVFYMLGYRWAFYQRFILYQFTLMWFLLKRMPRVKCRGTISKQIPNSLDRVDQQDFVICCRIYSNSKIWDPNQYWVVIFQVLDLYEAWYIYLRLKLDLLSMILYKKTITNKKKVLRQLLFMFSSVLTQIWKSCYFFFALSSTLVERRWWYLVFTKVFRHSSQALHENEREFYRRLTVWAIFISSIVSFLLLRIIFFLAYALE